MSRQTVLFLCTGNSARSQMAEALLRYHAGDRFEAFSAGIDPSGIHPLAVQVMDEIGISLASHSSKSVDQFLGKLAVRYAIIVCERAERECPKLWPFAANHLYWKFPDPVQVESSMEDGLEAFRNVRDAIDRRIRLWLEDDKPGDSDQ